jgi:RNA polymerase sigma-70 factor (ECF subfamily)
LGQIPRDDARFEALYKRFHHDVYKFLIRYTGQRQQAEDLTEETFLRAYKYGGFPDDEGEHARAWLFKTARRLAVDAWQRGLRDAEPFDMTDPSFPEPMSDDFTGRLADKIDVRRALRRLKPPDRALLWAYYNEEPIEQIAADLGIRVNTAHKRLNRARLRVERQYRRNNLPGNRFVHVRRS